MSAGATTDTNADVEGRAEHAPTPTTVAVTMPSLVVWIPAARLPVINAMEAAGIGVIDSPDGASYAVISTRLPRHRISEYTAQAIECSLEVVVLVHPGGESVAVEALRAGGQVAIAEGDADALRALNHEEVENDDRTNSLLDAYEARLGRAQAASRTNVTMFDPISGLPAAGALAVRLTASTYDLDQNLRMLAMSVSGLSDSSRLRLGSEAQALLHRRIATGVRLLCQPLGDLYDIGEGMFVLLAPQLSTVSAERLGTQLADMVGGYIPDGHAPLTVAIGHAGPECSTDLPTLRELAGRAESAARAEERSVTLGAGELVRPLATATELEVALRLADMAAQRDGGSPRHEIALVASEIAAGLGFEGRERVLIRFCAEVADIGSAFSEHTADANEAAAKMLNATAGPLVSGVLRSVGEHWDGSGGPDALSGAQIPASARIIAVAEALVAAKYSADTIEAGSGTLFDPTVVTVAAEYARQR